MKGWTMSESGIIRSGITRLTLHRYDRLHYAIDCESCGWKIANLNANKSGGEILDAIDNHYRKFHHLSELR